MNHAQVSKPPPCKRPSFPRDHTDILFTTLANAPPSSSSSSSSTFDHRSRSSTSSSNHPKLIPNNENYYFSPSHRTDNYSQFPNISCLLDPNLDLPNLSSSDIEDIIGRPNQFTNNLRLSRTRTTTTATTSSSSASSSSTATAAGVVVIGGGAGCSSGGGASGGGGTGVVVTSGNGMDLFPNGSCSNVDMTDNTMDMIREEDDLDDLSCSIDSAIQCHFEQRNASLPTSASLFNSRTNPPPPSSLPSGSATTSSISTVPTAAAAGPSLPLYPPTNNLSSFGLTLSNGGGGGMLPGGCNNNYNIHSLDIINLKRSCSLPTTTTGAPVVVHPMDSCSVSSYTSSPPCTTTGSSVVEVSSSGGGGGGYGGGGGLHIVDPPSSGRIMFYTPSTTSSCTSSNLNPRDYLGLETLHHSSVYYNNYPHQLNHHYSSSSATSNSSNRAVGALLLHSAPQQFHLRNSHLQPPVKILVGSSQPFLRRTTTKQTRRPRSETDHRDELLHLFPSCHSVDELELEEPNNKQFDEPTATEYDDWEDDSLSEAASFTGVLGGGSSSCQGVTVTTGGGGTSNISSNTVSATVLTPTNNNGNTTTTSSGTNNRLTNNNNTSNSRRGIVWRCRKRSCKESFDSRLERDTHFKEVHHVTAHKCNICGKSYPSETKLKAHSSSHLPFSERNAHMCPFPNCGKRYFNVDRYDRHIRNYHCADLSTMVNHPVVNNATVLNTPAGANDTVAIDNTLCQINALLNGNRPASPPLTQTHQQQQQQSTNHNCFDTLDLNCELMRTPICDDGIGGGVGPGGGGLSSQSSSRSCTMITTNNNNNMPPELRSTNSTTTISQQNNRRLSQPLSLTISSINSLNNESSSSSNNAITNNYRFTTSSSSNTTTTTNNNNVTNNNNTNNASSATIAAVAVAGATVVVSAAASVAGAPGVVVAGGGNGIHCRLCGLGPFLSTDELHVHTLSHSRHETFAASFDCPVEGCQFVFSRRVELSAHLHIHFPLSRQVFVYCCPIENCDTVCTDQQTFRDHFVKHVTGDIPGDINSVIPLDLPTPQADSDNPILGDLPPLENFEELSNDIYLIRESSSLFQALDLMPDIGPEEDSANYNQTSSEFLTSALTLPLTTPRIRQKSSVGGGGSCGNSSGIMAGVGSSGSGVGVGGSNYGGGAYGSGHGNHSGYMCSAPSGFNTNFFETPRIGKQEFGKQGFSTSSTIGNVGVGGGAGANAGGGPGGSVKRKLALLKPKLSVPSAPTNQTLSRRPMDTRSCSTSMSARPQMLQFSTIPRNVNSAPNGIALRPSVGVALNTTDTDNCPLHDPIKGSGGD